MTSRPAARSRRGRAVVTAAATLAAAVLATAAGAQAPHQHGHGAAPHAHDHPSVPARYARVATSPGTWTDELVLARGRALYQTHCAVCHGPKGEGDGPGVASTPLKPPSFRDAGMVAMMSPAYWYWRVSEGGTVEPFRSRGSTMPAWKSVLSEADRWAVIAFQHTFSGHRGPHGPGEHREMLTGH